MSRLGKPCTHQGALQRYPGTRHDRVCTLRFLDCLNYLRVEDPLSLRPTSHSSHHCWLPFCGEDRRMFPVRLLQPYLQKAPQEITQGNQLTQVLLDPRLPHIPQVNLTSDSQQQLQMHSTLPESPRGENLSKISACCMERNPQCSLYHRMTRYILIKE